MRFVTWKSNGRFLAYAAIVAVLLVVVYKNFDNTIHQDPAYAVAVYILNHDPGVKRAVGTLKTVKLQSGSSNGSAESGKAAYRFQVSGDKGNASVFVTLINSKGVWSQQGVTIQDVRK